MSDDTPDTNFKVIDTRSPETRARVAGDHVPDGRKKVEEALAPCPFCGGEPYWHGFDIRCSRCSASIILATTEEWNLRAPEPMNSVVRWKRYDGTPNTMPEDGEKVLLVRANQKHFLPELATALPYWPLISEWKLEGRDADFHQVDFQIGDEWARLEDARSQPPEGNTNA